MKKTLAALKRDAESGNLSLELVEWHRKTGDEIPRRLRGIRKVVGAYSGGITLEGGDGNKSQLPIDGAKLIEYTDDTLTVYAPGLREPTAEEYEVLAHRDRIMAEYTRRSPHAEPYWKDKEIFQESSCPWMSGFETVRGKRYIWATQMVQDNAVRGDAMLRYKVHLSDN